MTKLSIIVPVYNVENYIRPCIESIFRQGLDDNDFEIIIVNDGTRDRSMEMIAEIINQHHNISVINQENQGLSVARNNGIAQAKGEYIFMPDSDDLVIENGLPPLLEIALRTKVDIVVADFLLMNDEQIANFNGITQNDLIIKEKKGEQLMIEDLDPHQCYVWRSLFRKEFITYNHIYFLPDVCYQDVPFTHECYLKANRCIRTNHLLYLYRRGREGATTSSYNIKKGKDFCKVIAHTWELTKLDNPPRIQRKLKDDIFTSFSRMIFQTRLLEKRGDRQLVIDCMKQLAPDLSFTNGFRQRLYTLMYRYLPHILTDIRYLYRRAGEECLFPLYYHIIKKDKL